MASTDAWEAAVRAQVEDLKQWEQAHRPPPPQPMVAQTQARFVGIITLSTPQAAQELSGLILQYIRGSVDIFYVLKERPEQRSEFLRVAHRMMSLIETFPNVVQNGSDQAEARNQISVMRTAHLASMNIITEHRAGTRMSPDVSKILAGHLRTVLNQLVIISRMMEELHSKVTIRSAEKAEQITTIIRNTLYSDQWDDKERIFNMHLDSTISLVQSRVNALKELNDNTDAGPRIASALQRIANSRDALLRAAVRGFEMGDPSATHAQQAHSSEIIGALGEIRVVFTTLATQARANYDFQFAMKAQLQQVVRAMEAGQFAAAEGYAERVRDEISRLNRSILEEAEPMADGSAGLNDAMARLRNVTDALLRATRSARQPDDVKAVRLLADDLQQASTEVTVGSANVHNASGMLDAARLAAQQLHQMVTGNEAAARAPPSPAAPLSPQLRLQAAVAVAPPEVMSPQVQLRSANTAREAEERIKQMNARLAATEVAVAKRAAKEEEVEDLLAQLSSQLSQSLRNNTASVTVTTRTVVTENNLAQIEAQRRREAEEELARVEKERSLEESARIKQQTIAQVQAQMEATRRRIEEEERAKNAQKYYEENKRLEAERIENERRQRIADEERRARVAAEHAEEERRRQADLKREADRRAQTEAARRHEEEAARRARIAAIQAATTEEERRQHTAALMKAKEEEDRRKREGETALELRRAAEEEKRKQEVLAAHNARIKADEERRLQQQALLAQKQPLTIHQIAIAETERQVIPSPVVSPTSSSAAIPKPPPVTPASSNANFVAEDELEKQLRVAEAKLLAYQNNLQQSGKTLDEKVERRKSSKTASPTVGSPMPASPQPTSFRDPSGIALVKARVPAEPSPDPAFASIKKDSIPRVPSTERRTSNPKAEPMARSVSGDAVARRAAQEEELARRRALEREEEELERKRIADEQEHAREARRAEEERRRQEEEAFNRHEREERERLRQLREAEKARREAEAERVRREASAEMSPVKSTSPPSSTISNGSKEKDRRSSSKKHKEHSSGSRIKDKESGGSKTKRTEPLTSTSPRSRSGKHHERREKDRRKKDNDSSRSSSKKEKEDDKKLKKSRKSSRRPSASDTATQQVNPSPPTSLPAEASPPASPVIQAASPVVASPPPLNVDEANSKRNPDEVRPHEVSPHLAAALNAALNEPLGDAKKREKGDKKRKKELEKQKKEQEKQEKDAQRKSGFRKSLLRALGKDEVKKAEKESKD